MDKSLLMFQPGTGVRSAKRMLGDGEERAEHTLHFRPRNPSQIAAFYGAERRFPDTDAGDFGREQHRAKFIAESLCDETGAQLMTFDEAMMIPVTLKPEICAMITAESNRPGDAGKRSPPAEPNGSGTSSP